MRLGVSPYYPLAITSFLCFLLIQKHENRGTSGISLIFPALSPALDVNEPHYSSMSEVSPEEKYWTSMTLPCVVMRKRLSWMLLSEDISQKLGESGFSRVQKFWRIVDVEKVLLSRQENLWMIRFDCFVQDSKNKITNIIKKSRYSRDFRNTAQRIILFSRTDRCILWNKGTILAISCNYLGITGSLLIEFPK